MSALLRYAESIPPRVLAEAGVYLTIAALLIYVALRLWRRRADRLAREASDRSMRCTHGKLKWKSCPDCAAAFALGVDAERLAEKKPEPIAPGTNLYRDYAGPIAVATAAVQVKFNNFPVFPGPLKAIPELVRALKTLIPDQRIQVDEFAWREQGILKVTIANVGYFEGNSPAEIFDQVRIRLAAPLTLGDRLRGI